MTSFGKSDWMQKASRMLADNTGSGYQTCLLFVREHKQEILSLAKAAASSGAKSVPGAEKTETRRGNLYGFRGIATAMVWKNVRAEPD